jgi:DNA-binding response OmpR family regulator
MILEPDLSGHRVLVVEDEYYIAKDAARALRGAGADVLGPCRDEEAANIVVALNRPDAVLVDIDLGDGPCFTLAESLRASGIPFLFVTGYDDDMIPPKFDKVERLLKPVEPWQMLTAVSRLLNPGAA